MEHLPKELTSLRERLVGTSFLLWVEKAIEGKNFSSFLKRLTNQIDKDALSLHNDFNLSSVGYAPLTHLQIHGIFYRSELHEISSNTRFVSHDDTLNILRKAVPLMIDLIPIDFDTGNDRKGGNGPQHHRVSI